MAVKATCLVGLDVHARQTHAAVLDLRSGELETRRLVGVPEEVVAFLEGLPAAGAWRSMRRGRPGSGWRGLRAAWDRCAGRRARVDPEGRR